MEFRDLYFEFEVEPVKISTLKLKLKDGSIIPKQFHVMKKYKYFDEIFANKDVAVEAILGVHYNYYKNINHIDLFEKIINKSEIYISLNYETRKNAIIYSNLVFFGKIPIQDALKKVFRLEELTCYGY